MLVINCACCTIVLVVRSACSWLCLLLVVLVVRCAQINQLQTEETLVRVNPSPSLAVCKQRLCVLSFEINNNLIICFFFKYPSVSIGQILRI